MAKRSASEPLSAFVGVDVGTGSARAAVFSVEGALLGDAAEDIKMNTPRPEHFEQSSEDIWQACCRAVRTAVAAAGNVEVCGLAFDATCSLVVLSADDRPLSVGVDAPDAAEAPSSGEAGADPVFNIIVWCDHRATDEADAINATGHRLLSNVGGAVSPEMEMPKLSWLRRHRPRTYRAARRFLDLADYLTYRAGGGCTAAGEAAGLRSACTVVCKWNFDADGQRWDEAFLKSIGLDDLGEHRIGAPADVRDVGARVPGGVAGSAAEELGLRAGVALGVGIIDAHAGGLGCLGGEPSGVGGPGPGCGPDALPLAARLALIAGTSTCHMASSSAPVFVPGVWGPYASAMVPGLFLNEGGQSAAGSGLDFLIETHAAFPALQAAAEAQRARPSAVLNARVQALARERGHSHPAFLAAGLFVGPDLNGCRSPLADPRLRGSVIGLGPPGPAEEATSVDALAILYLAATQALAYSTRSIVEAVNRARLEKYSRSCEQSAEVSEQIRAVFACGGLASNDLYISTHADALGMPVYLPKEPSAAMPLGGAVLAAAAAGAFPSVAEAMRSMGGIDSVVAPCQDPKLKRFHDARYEVFLRMQRHQQEYRALEAQALG